MPVNGAKYREASQAVFAILTRYTPDIQPISIDEAFLDLTGSCHLFGTPVQTGQKIKDDIRRETRLTASIGLAPVKFVAKIASDFGKPDGLFEVKPDGVLDFLWPLPIERLWGVGEKSREALNRLGIMRIGDIARTPKEKLFRLLGENGLHLYALSQGIDPRPVVVDDEVKSVSHEHTFDSDVTDADEVRRILFILTQKVSRRLRKQDLKGRTISLKIRLKGFETYSRSHTFSQRTNHVHDMHPKALELFNAFARTGMAYRLIGIRMAGFDDPYVSDGLFSDSRVEKHEDVHRAVDRIKDRFGEGTIHWGSL
jgi:DNA polymerase-4